MNEITLQSTALPLVSSCDFCVTSEDFFHADRVADFHVLIYVTQGEMFVTEAGQAYTIRPGELLFLKAGLHHYGEQATLCGTSWHYFHFSLPCGEPLPPFTPEQSELTPFARCAFSALLPKRLTGLIGSPLEQCLIETTEYCHGADSMRLWNINARFFALLTQIAFYGLPLPCPTSLVERICAYLSTHCTQPFSAQALEKAFFLSYKTMAARFKREKGVTMQQYHTQLRMRAACRLLRTTLAPIGEIAERVGYADMLYFSHRFHACMGMSPSSYRKTSPRV